MVKNYPPLSEEEMAAFELDQPGAPVCNPANFRVDFSRPWKRCQFNKHARWVFIKHTVEKGKLGFWEVEGVPKSLFYDQNVGAALDAHIPHCWREWHEAGKRNYKISHKAELKKKAVASRKDTVSTFVLLLSTRD
jgi:hypothetical protein